MYQMTPIYFKPDGYIARHTGTMAKAVLAVLAAIAVAAILLLALSVADLAWLR